MRCHLKREVAGDEGDERRGRQEHTMNDNSGDKHKLGEVMLATWPAN